MMYNPNMDDYEPTVSWEVMMRQWTPVPDEVEADICCLEKTLLKTRPLSMNVPLLHQYWTLIALYLYKHNVLLHHDGILTLNSEVLGLLHKGDFYGGIYHAFIHVRKNESRTVYIINELEKPPVKIVHYVKDIDKEIEDLKRKLGYCYQDKGKTR